MRHYVSNTTIIESLIVNNYSIIKKLDHLYLKKKQIILFTSLGIFLKISTNMN